MLVTVSVLGNAEPFHGFQRHGVAQIGQAGDLPHREMLAGVQLLQVGLAAQSQQRRQRYRVLYESRLLVSLLFASPSIIALLSGELSHYTLQGFFIVLYNSTEMN